MRAGQAIGSKTELGFEDLLVTLEAALEGIKMRGKAVKGEKTIVDALEPAVEALKSSPTIDINLMEEAVKAAEAGVEYIKGIIAKKGRASYLGERSIGHQDPGATSCHIMLTAILKGIKDS